MFVPRAVVKRPRPQPPAKRRPQSEKRVVVEDFRSEEAVTASQVPTSETEIAEQSGRCY